MFTTCLSLTPSACPASSCIHIKSLRWCLLNVVYLRLCHGGVVSSRTVWVKLARFVPEHQCGAMLAIWNTHCCCHPAAVAKVNWQHVVKFCVVVFFPRSPARQCDGTSSSRGSKHQSRSSPSHIPAEGQSASHTVMWRRYRCQHAGFRRFFYLTELILDFVYIYEMIISYFHVLCFDFFHFENCGDQWFKIKMLDDHKSRLKTAFIRHDVCDTCCDTSSPLFHLHRSHLTFSETACCLPTDRCFTSSVIWMWKGTLQCCAYAASFWHIHFPDTCG